MNGLRNLVVTEAEKAFTGKVGSQAFFWFLCLMEELGREESVSSWSYELLWQMRPMRLLVSTIERSFSITFQRSLQFKEGQSNYRKAKI